MFRNLDLFVGARDLPAALDIAALISVNEGAGVTLGPDGLAPARLADDQVEHGRVKRLLERASNHVSAHPGDLGVPGLEAREAQPQIGAFLKDEMGFDPEAVGRQIHDLDRNIGGAALAHTRVQRDFDAR